MTDPRAPSCPLASVPSPWGSETLIEDRFQVIRELGHGGMGAVYLVFDRELCRELALKRIHPAAAGRQNVEERFRREYRALAAIGHPGVPQIHHSGRTTDGAAWFTMESVRGESLRSIFDRDRLDPARALNLAIQLGEILAAAHEVGIIHRDVKPSNVMVEPGDRVRLLDFGICTALPRFLRAADARRRTATVDRWNSGEMSMAGTLGYSDPTTFEGNPATIRSDIFSLAAILYEALTGRRLCDPDSLVYRSIDSAELPLALAALVVDLRRATSHNPFERHHTMAEFVQCLEISRGHLARAAAEDPVARRSVVVPLLLGLVLGLVLALAARGLEPSDPRPTSADMSREPGLSRTARPPPIPDPSGAPGPSPSALPAPSPAPGPSPPPDPVVAPALVDTPRPVVAPPRGEHPETARARARRLLDGQAPAIARCVDDEGRPQRRLTLTLTLDPRGTVRDVRLASGEHSGLSRCIKTALSDMSFPTGLTPVNHTYEFPSP